MDQIFLSGNENDTADQISCTYLMEKPNEITGTTLSRSRFPPAVATIMEYKKEKNLNYLRVLTNDQAIVSHCRRSRNVSFFPPPLAAPPLTVSISLSPLRSLRSKRHRCHRSNAAAFVRGELLAANRAAKNGQESSRSVHSNVKQRFLWPVNGGRRRYGSVLDPCGR